MGRLQIRAPIGAATIDAGTYNRDMKARARASLAER
jgi:hypothetical protein